MQSATAISLEYPGLWNIRKVYPGVLLLQELRRIGRMWWELSTWVRPLC